MRHIVLGCLAVLLITPHGVAENKSINAAASVQTEKELAELRAQIKQLQGKVDDLAGQLNLYYTFLSEKQDRKDSISLNLTEKTFQRLDMDDGFLLVSVESVEPYLTGYKLHLSIGNPLTASYAGFKAKVKWSKAYDYSKFTAASYEEWKKGVQEKDFELTDFLSGGSWNPVELILTPATAEQLGDVELSISTDTVRLHTANK